MVAGKQEIEPQKLALDSLNAIIMDNKAMIHQSRATIEENRLLILSNQSAAALGNQQLANHNDACSQFAPLAARQTGTHHSMADGLQLVEGCSMSVSRSGNYWWWPHVWLLSNYPPQPARIYHFQRVTIRARAPAL